MKTVPRWRQVRGGERCRVRGLDEDEAEDQGKAKGGDGVRDAGSRAA